MTIDEEIQRIKEKMACDYNISGCDTCNISSCEDKDIVIQLTEWLEELKAYRNLHEQDKKVYNKAIDDFVNACKEDILCQTFGLRECDIVKIAEQLKAGEENE